MDWNHPEHVFGSSLDPVVLRALWGTTGSMTGAQVHRVARKGSDRGVQQALLRLAEQGIVTVEQAGQALLYSLNRAHYAFPAIDAAFNALRPWQDLRDDVKRIAAKHFELAGPESEWPVSVALFGSVARREARLDSDIDFLVVAPDSFADPAQELADSLRDLERKTGQRVQVYLTDPGRLLHAVAVDDPIIESFRSDAETIVGPDVRTYFRGPR